MATARVRLQRYLSQSGVAARRKAEILIADGRVRVNGRVVTELGTSVDPAVDRVTVDGQAAHPLELFYCLLNKPKGTITAVSDPEGRPTVMEYLATLPIAVKPVGRLDFYSEGVLLLTNDGELSSALQSPRNHVEKTYHVKVRGQVREAHINLMRRGVRLDDGTVTRPPQIDRLRAESRHDWLVITLTEGKSRQIHRMAESLGYQVLKLQRVAFAGLDYYGLRVGDARELTQAEVSSLRDLVGLPRTANAGARGAWRSRREDSDLARRARERQRQAGVPVAAGAGAAPPEVTAAPHTRRATPRGARHPDRGREPSAPRSDTRSSARPGPRSPSRTGPRPDSRSASRTGPRPGSRSASRTGPRPDSRSASRPGPRPDSRSASRPGPRPDARSNPRTGPRTNPRANAGTKWSAKPARNANRTGRRPPRPGRR
ncbi:MAG TPA: pseudouridine synthase [Kofleriaceae bacterium]|nr:pseudouridine synthase [Kofleriaceae bacterium]